MADRSRLDPSKSPGLHRSIPCQNISGADGYAWQSPSYSGKSQPDDRRLDFSHQQSENFEKENRTGATGIPSLRQYETKNARPKDGLNLVTGSVNKDAISNYYQPSDYNRLRGDESGAAPAGRGFINTKQQNSLYNCNNGIDKGKEMSRGENDRKNSSAADKWTAIQSDGGKRDFRQPTTNNGADSLSSSSSSSSVAAKKTSIGTPETIRRSSIPVRTHRRSSSASADDATSSLRFNFQSEKSQNKNVPMERYSTGMQPQMNDIRGTSTAQRQTTNPALTSTTRHFSSSNNSGAINNNDSHIGRRSVENNTIGKVGMQSLTTLRPKYRPSLDTISRLQSAAIKFETPQRTQTIQQTPRKSVQNNNSTLMTGSERRSRISVPTKSSVSQPGSRSTSPSGRLSYITYRPESSRPTSARNGTTERLKGSRIPRSQGQSRDTSPSRSSDGVDRSARISFSSSTRTQIPKYETPQKTSLMSANILQTGPDMEEMMTDALSVALRLEDATSETSSVSSESFSHTVLSPQEMINKMSSASWSDRRQGLFALQNLMKSNGMLNCFEVKKVTEIFTRMFHDPNVKVFNIFLETLVDVLEVHSEDMVDWLYTCLSRLLVKLTSDLLGSIQARIHKALKAVCGGFSFDVQLTAITRFLSEQTHASNLKVRLAILDHLHEMAVLCEPSDFVNSECCQQVALSVVQWSMEPKSFEIRKASQGVVIALFNLNTPEFSAVLSRLPRSIQDCATKILHNHMFNVSQPEKGLTDESVASDSNYAYKSGRYVDRDEDEMSTEDFVTSLKKTSKDIENLSFLD